MIKKFNRYELKYILTYKEYVDAVKFLKGFLRRDRHSGEEGVYRISSLYYDSLDLSCYRNKIDGIKYRRKLRLRVYEDSNMEYGFVEINNGSIEPSRSAGLRCPWMKPEHSVRERISA